MGFRKKLENQLGNCNREARELNVLILTSHHLSASPHLIRIRIELQMLVMETQECLPELQP